MDELEQAIVEFGWHPDEIKPRDKTWLHERRNWMGEVENLRTFLQMREGQVKFLDKELNEVREEANNYWEAWQDAAIYWKDVVRQTEQERDEAIKERDARRERSALCRHLEAACDQMEVDRENAREAAETYHIAWQDAATCWKDRVAALETVLQAARKWRDQYRVNVERGMVGLMRGDEFVVVLETYDHERRRTQT